MSITSTSICNLLIPNVIHSANGEGNYRAHAYEAVGSYVTNAPSDQIAVVQQTAVTFLQRLEHMLTLQVRPHSLFCNTLFVF